MSARFAKFAPLGAIAIAAFVAAAPQSANAAPFDITYTGIVPDPGERVDYTFNTTNGSAQAGAFNMSATDQGQNSNLIGNFLAWCFDLTGTISSGANNNPYEFDDTNDFLSGPGLTRVQSVFDTGYSDAIDTSGLNDNQVRVKRAGFQVAIWEAIYDGLTVNGLEDGNFSLRNTGVNSDEADINTAAGNFLTAAQGDNTGSDKWKIIQLNATDSDVQDLATVIPLPAAAWLLLGVSGALIAAKRRSARKEA